MPTQYVPRPAPCTHCGDTVLVASYTAPPLFGFKRRKPATVHLEHADPSPDGEVHDGVDDACHRARVA